MTDGRIEPVILRSLLFDEDISKRLLPHIQAEYFQNRPEKILFQIIKDLTECHEKAPTPEAVIIALSNARGLHEDDFRGARQSISDIIADRVQRLDWDWLKVEAEKFIKNRAMTNAVMEAATLSTEKARRAKPPYRICWPKRWPSAWSRPAPA